MKRDSFIRDITHEYEDVTHACETCFIHLRHNSSTAGCCPIFQGLCQRHDSFTWDSTHAYETRLLYMKYDSFTWDSTHSYETRLLHMKYDSSTWNMTRLEQDVALFAKDPVVPARQRKRGCRFAVVYCALCVAQCCSVLQRDAAWCSVMQRDAVYCRISSAIQAQSQAAVSR